MPVSDVDDDDVGAGAQELRGTLEIVALGPDRGADAKAAVSVPGGKGKPLLLDQILGSDQAEEPPVASPRAEAS